MVERLCASCSELGNPCLWFAFEFIKTFIRFIRFRNFCVPNISMLDSYQLGNDYVDFVSPESCQAHVGSSVNFSYK